MGLTRKDPYGSYNFAVELDGLTSAGFKSCSGLDTTTSTVAYREGTDAGLVSRALPGMVTFSPIVLARGVTTDSALWEWRNTVVDGAPMRKTISIILRNDQGQDKIRWNIVNCWPAKWSGPNFDAATDSTAIESLELAHEGIELQTWS